MDATNTKNDGIPTIIYAFMIYLIPCLPFSIMIYANEIWNVDTYEWPINQLWDSNGIDLLIPGIVVEVIIFCIAPFLIAGWIAKKLIEKR